MYDIMLPVLIIYIIIPTKFKISSVTKEKMWTLKQKMFYNDFEVTHISSFIIVPVENLIYLFC